MTKKYYATYKGREVNSIKFCENCGSGKHLYIIPYSDVISVECDNCQYGKGLWKEKDSNVMKIQEIEKLIDDLLNESDKEMAMYLAKAKLNKIKQSS